MPVYVYKCPDKHYTEKLQEYKDKPLEKCPICGKPVEKVIKHTTFIFKDK